MGFPENTSGRTEALRALRESRRGRQRTREVLETVNRQLERSAQLRERNHFTDGIRNMLRGAT